MRVMPPTSRTSLMSLELTPASFMQSLHGCLVRFSSPSTRDSNLHQSLCLGFYHLSIRMGPDLCLYLDARTCTCASCSSSAVQGRNLKPGAAISGLDSCLESDFDCSQLKHCPVGNHGTEG